MIASLLQFVGRDIKRLARETAITVALMIFGALAGIATLAFGFTALYLWLEILLGTFATLGILGGTSAVLALALIAIAFWRAPRNPRALVEDTLRAAAGPGPAKAAVLTKSVDEAMKNITETMRDGSRQQIVATIATAAFIGWLLGRRS